MDTTIVALSPVIPSMQSTMLSSYESFNSVQREANEGLEIRNSDLNQSNFANDRSSKNQKNLVKKVAEDFNKLSENLKLDIKFAYNDKIEQAYLKVIDKRSGEVIRKLPSEAAMKISETMKELVGTLFDKKG